MKTVKTTLIVLATLFAVFFLIPMMFIVGDSVVNCKDHTSGMTQQQINECSRLQKSMGR